MSAKGLIILAAIAGGIYYLATRVIEPAMRIKSFTLGKTEVLPADTVPFSLEYDSRFSGEATLEIFILDYGDEAVATIPFDLDGRISGEFQMPIGLRLAMMETALERGDFGYVLEGPVRVWARISDGFGVANSPYRQLFLQLGLPNLKDMALAVLEIAVGRLEDVLQNGDGDSGIFVKLASFIDNAGHSMGGFPIFAGVLHNLAQKCSEIAAELFAGQTNIPKMELLVGLMNTAINLIRA